jgi:hypothetical protein
MLITTLGPLALDGTPVRGRRLAAMIRELVDARGRDVSVATLVGHMARATGHRGSGPHPPADGRPAPLRVTT